MQAGAETDDACIQASRQGDREAFARLIERYQRAVYAVAFSGVRDRARADDITPDTFVIAWRQLDELRDSKRLGAWLCGIARNLARDARRRTRRETLVDVDDVAHPTTPFDAMSEAEAERIIAAALGQVPDVYREPLVLYYYEQRSVDDVARYIGISAATTNKRLSRGRRYLAERVAIVERGVAWRGPSPGLAASVLALVGVAASASHVDASPVAVKGSTMHKLAIATVATASLAGAGFLVVTAVRGSAHAQTPTAHATAGGAPAAAPTTATRAAAHGANHAGCAPSLSALLGRVTATANANASANAGETTSGDCAAVGRYLADLEADATHGPDARPDDATQTACATYYIAQCEREGWSAERRSCTLAAADLINAHLCAGNVATVAPASLPTTIPAALTCDALATELATKLQAAGLFGDAPDLPQQLEAACDSGSWSLELRQCFAAGSDIQALHACIQPAGLQQAHE